MASNLPRIWQSDVYARGAGWLFLIWLIPLVITIVRKVRQGTWHPDFLLLVLSLLACIVGVLGSLNIARHVAFGLALGGQAAPSIWKWFWLAGMLSWLPATGWLARDIPGNGWILRSAILLLSIAASINWWKGNRS